MQFHLGISNSFKSTVLKASLFFQQQRDTQLICGLS
jgi:hypothetical protein